jgi:hypothetical protein
MAEGDENDFGNVYEANSRRSHLSAYVLVAGLVLELVNATIWYKGPETLAEMAAVLLIVGGVWGEIFFGHKARIAGDKQLAQYEARAAEANQKASEAEARASEANQKAQEAILELAQFREPRILTGQQMVRIAEKLKQFSSTEYDVALQSNDPEFIGFLWFIEIALEKAGWKGLSWPSMATVITSRGLQVAAGISVTNIVVGINLEQTSLRLADNVLLMN